VREVIRAPALVSGNSSGGIMALRAASIAPEWVRGIVLEDPPLFTTEHPRAKETWVQGFFEHTVRTLPDLALYFSTLTIPRERGVELMKFPRPLAWILGGAIRRHQAAHPGAPVDLWWLPLHVRLFVRGLSEYDVDFTRARFRRFQATDDTREGRVVRAPDARARRRHGPERADRVSQHARHTPPLRF
jgi:pimeloyl-ACP methyl ester carboxylesterase